MFAGRIASKSKRPSARRAEYEYSLWDYRTDPNFSAVEAPTHLVPADRDQHAAKASLDFNLGRFRLGVGGELFVRRYFF